jgi:hypothetical protein
MTRYRKLPVEVDAFKWTGDEHQTEDPVWICDALRNGDAVINPATDKTPCQMAIHTLEGVMIANFGDYIIRGTKGEIYPCKPDIFKTIYEEVK